MVAYPSRLCFPMENSIRRPCLPSNAAHQVASKYTSGGSPFFSWAKEGAWDPRFVPYLTDAAPPYGSVSEPHFGSEGLTPRTTTGITLFEPWSRGVMILLFSQPESVCLQRNPNTNHALVRFFLSLLLRTLPAPVTSADPTII